MKLVCPASAKWENHTDRLQMLIPGCVGIMWPQQKDVVTPIKMYPLTISVISH